MPWIKALRIFSKSVLPEIGAGFQTEAQSTWLHVLALAE